MFQNLPRKCWNTLGGSRLVHEFCLPIKMSVVGFQVTIKGWILWPLLRGHFFRWLDGGWHPTCSERWNLPEGRCVANYWPKWRWFASARYSPCGHRISHKDRTSSKLGIRINPAALSCSGHQWTLLHLCRSRTHYRNFRLLPLPLGHNSSQN